MTFRLDRWKRPDWSIVVLSSNPVDLVEKTIFLKLVETLIEKNQSEMFSSHSNIFTIDFILFDQILLAIFD